MFVEIGDAEYTGIRSLDYRIRPTFEVGYMVLRVQLLDMESICCLLGNINRYICHVLSNDMMSSNFQ